MFGFVRALPGKIGRHAASGNSIFFRLRSIADYKNLAQREMVAKRLPDYTSS
jgi:hypothetical protein